MGETIDRNHIRQTLGYARVEGKKVATFSTDLLDKR